MAFCEQCGTQLAAVAAFCSGCGTAVKAAAMPQVVSQPAFQPDPTPAGVALPQTDTASQAAPTDDLSGLSEKWRRRFAAIEKGGGEGVRWWRLPNAGQLTGEDRRLIFLNIWGFFFGPLYYLFLGMWRRAITLTLVVLVIDLILVMAGYALNFPIDDYIWVVGSVFFSQSANRDYYRKTVLKRREWW
jgi:hypothetical protein